MISCEREVGGGRGVDELEHDKFQRNLK